MIGSVVRQVVELARARNRRLEARRLRDDVVGQDPAVAPAADSQAVGIGDAHRDRRVDRCHHVVVILVAPVGEDRAAEVAAVAGRSPRVRGDDGEAARGEHLPFEVEAGGVLRDRAAVDAQDRRQPALSLVEGRTREVRVDHRAVGALRLETFDRPEGDLRQKFVVDVGQLRRHRADAVLWGGAFPPSLVCGASELRRGSPKRLWRGGGSPAGSRPGKGRATKKKDFSGLLGLRVEHGDVAGHGDVEGRHLALAAEDAHDGAAGRWHSGEMAVAAVFEQEQHAGAIGAELRARHVAIEPRRQDLRGAAGGRHERDVVGRVPDVFRSAAREVGDRFAVGAEHRRSVAARRRRHGTRLRAGARLDDVDVAVVVGVRIVRAVRAEGDERAVRRPCRRPVVVAIGGELEVRLGGDVEHVDVALDVVQIAVAVAHELQARDDVRLGLLVRVIARRVTSLP